MNNADPLPVTLVVGGGLVVEVLRPGMPGFVSGEGTERLLVTPETLDAMRAAVDGGWPMQDPRVSGHPLAEET